MTTRDGPRDLPQSINDPVSDILKWVLLVTAICFEDPRLPLMMSAPARADGAPEELRSLVTVDPRPGLLLLWESWLRHEVLPAAAKGDRLSISFNFA